MEIIARTRRLALRAWTLEDSAEMFALHSDPRVWQFLTSRAQPDLAATRARLATMIESTRARGYGFWALVENDGDAFVGYCGFRPGFEEKELEVGFMVAPSRWGRGYATEIARATVDLGFERYAAPRIWSLTSPANVPARRVLAKIGMGYVRDLEEEGATWAVYVREGSAPAPEVKGAT